jgi:uncharacterized protein YjbI with pentapeptide repeats
MSDSNPFAGEAEFYDKVFEGVDVRGATITNKEFHDCVFTKSVFTDTEFSRCKFFNCQFTACDLSNASIKMCVWREPKFTESKMIGINWTASLTLSHLTFTACVLSYANFSGCDLRLARFERCIMREAELGGANLSEADCRGTDFAGCQFSNSNLTKADFRGAVSYTIRPSDNKIYQARFSLPEAVALLHGLDIKLD